MLNRMQRNGMVIVAAACALALVGCGKGGGNSSGGGGGGASTAPMKDSHVAKGGGEVAQGAKPAGTSSKPAPTADAAPAKVALDDSSATAALNTYMNRLKAGDLLGAAEICVAEAPGTDALKTIGGNIQNMLDKPEDKSQGELALSLFIGDFKTLEAHQILEEEGVVVFEVGVVGKPPVNIRVENREGGWRVIPPVNGTPLG
ncbi:MAG: hypothetical protein H6814_07360 [Phycisphaeraceae bacterium]|nr:hypothetical protein [Phycisphaeraceae bacterium]